MSLAGRILQRRTLNELVVRNVDLRKRGSQLGLRIVLGSDLHARDDWFDRRCVARVVERINEIERVDLVALVGDFVGDDERAMTWARDELARIDAPTFAVLGNHDHWTSSRFVTRQLELAGVTVLTNAALPLTNVVEHAASNVWIAGIDSCWWRRGTGGPGANIEAAFADVPADARAVVLGHEPHLATRHEHQLHLAGHTHCGQVRLPLLGDLTARMHMPRYSEPYACRLYEVPVEAAGDVRPRGARSDRRWVYTTSGIGFSTVDTRLLCPPELVVIDA